VVSVAFRVDAKSVNDGRFGRYADLTNPKSNGGQPSASFPAMSDEKKKLVQQTFAQVVPIADQAAALFYGRLFELDPSLRSLFKSDLGTQGKKLMQMIGYCVGKLNSLDELVPAVKDLGRKHAGYGVEASMYQTVGAALLWTLDKGLGAAFTPEVKGAWTEVYGILSATMLEGARAA
jgi:hemoglobin-like flavoprotein